MTAITMAMDDQFTHGLGGNCLRAVCMTMAVFFCSSAIILPVPLLIHSSPVFSLVMNLSGVAFAGIQRSALHLSILQY